MKTETRILVNPVRVKEGWIVSKLIYGCKITTMDQFRALNPSEDTETPHKE